MSTRSRRIFAIVVVLSACLVFMTPQAGRSSPPGRVTEMHLEAIPHSIQSATCPFTIHFNGFIRADGPLTMSYGIDRSDGGRGPGGELHFQRAGSQSVHFTWQLGARGQTYNGWAQIGSGMMRSNRAAFHLQCRP